ncbi:MAG: aminoglycoside phosphotransferase family protein [Terriglobia bacterium]
MKVPEPVAQMLLACHQEEGRQWLDNLPRVLEELCERWQLRLGTPFEGGCVAFVAPAQDASGRRVVLKVSILDDETRQEGDALAFWAGRGAVQLMDRDPEHGALLLERAEPGIPLSSLPDQGDAMRIGCEVLRRLWRPIQSPHPFQTVRQLVTDWSRTLKIDYENAGKPFPQPLVDCAVDLCGELADSEEAPVVANRDFHFGNVVAATREPWLAIDPKPLAGERAFDTGYLLRALLSDGFDAAEVRRVARCLSAELQLPMRRIAAWALVRAIDNALWCLEAKQPGFELEIACAEALLDLTAQAPGD